MSSVEGAASADAAHASGKWTWWKAITHSASQLHAGGAARRQGTYWHGCGAALGATSNQLLPERAPAPPPCEAGGKLALGAPAAWAGVLGSKRVAAWPVAHELASLYVHSLCNLRGCGCGCGCGCDRLRSVKCRPPGGSRKGSNTASQLVRSVFVFQSTMGSYEDFASGRSKVAHSS
jgi:hypothetical protein